MTVKDNAGELVTTEWPSIIASATKMDDSLQFCVDYRKLTAIIVRDSYPKSRMDGCIDSLASAEVFSKPDANSGY